MDLALSNTYRDITLSVYYNINDVIMLNALVVIEFTGKLRENLFTLRLSL